MSRQRESASTSQTVAPQSPGYNFHRRTYAEVDTERIKANFGLLRGMSRSPFFCPMVKANAYGHGDIEVARALRDAGARYLGVGLIEEGIHLRHAGDKGTILLMGIFEERSARAVLNFELTPVLSAWHELESLLHEIHRRSLSPSQGSPNSLPLKVHLKFNTGMNRLGFEVEEAPQLRAWFDQQKAGVFEVEGICTHLLRGEDFNFSGGESELQLARFATSLKAFSDLPILVHALNSSAVAAYEELAWERALHGAGLAAPGHWPLGMRPGIAIYGIAPSGAEANHKLLALQPCLSLKSEIVLLHRVPKGGRVSYGPSWVTARDSVIGVVPVGYGDGYFRALSNKSSVLCKGRRVRICGTICMDYFMVDLTDLSSSDGVAIGEEVVLIGEQQGERIRAQELADFIGTIPYEILTNITERVPRVYLHSGPSVGSGQGPE